MVVNFLEVLILLKQPCHSKQFHLYLSKETNQYDRKTTEHAGIVSCLFFQKPESKGEGSQGPS